MSEESFRKINSLQRISINAESRNREQLEQLAGELSENSEALKDLLLFFWENGIETWMSCSATKSFHKNKVGIRAFASILLSEENKDKALRIISEISDEDTRHFNLVLSQQKRENLASLNNKSLVFQRVRYCEPLTDEEADMFFSRILEICGRAFGKAQEPVDSTGTIKKLFIDTLNGFFEEDFPPCFSLTLNNQKGLIMHVDSSPILQEIDTMVWTTLSQNISFNEMLAEIENAKKESKRVEEEERATTAETMRFFQNTPI